MNFIPYLVTDFSDMKNRFWPGFLLLPGIQQDPRGLGVKMLGIYVEGLIDLVSPTCRKTRLMRLLQKATWCAALR
jgi:hypothetical protein